MNLKKLAHMRSPTAGNTLEAFHWKGLWNAPPATTAPTALNLNIDEPVTLCLAMSKVFIRRSCESVVTLAEWSVYELPLLGPDFIWSRHISGYTESKGLPQDNAAIGTHVPEKGTGVSLSGRVFQLVGDSGRNLESARMWARWNFLSSMHQDRDLKSNFFKVMYARQGSACV